VTVSCDTFFYNLAHLMGINAVADYLKRFGFGAKTGIDMHEELGGLIPTPKWKRRVKGEPWYGGETVSVGIGQGYILVTPLQLSYGAATIANRGKRVRPHLLEKMVTPEGKIKPHEIQNDDTLYMPEYAWDTVIEAMRRVIRSPGGTGYRFGRTPPL